MRQEFIFTLILFIGICMYSAMFVTCKLLLYIFLWKISFVIWKGETTLYITTVGTSEVASY